MTKEEIAAVAPRAHLDAAVYEVKKLGPYRSRVLRRERDRFDESRRYRSGHAGSAAASSGPGSRSRDPRPRDDTSR